MVEKFKNVKGLGGDFEKKTLQKDLEYDKENWDVSIDSDSDEIIFSSAGFKQSIRIKKYNADDVCFKVKQISADKFIKLTYSVMYGMRYLFNILKVDKEGIDLVFEKGFYKLYNIDDNTILFYDDRYNDYTSYSIESNEKKTLDFPKDFETRVIDKSDDKNEKDIVLHVTKTLKSEYGESNDYIQFLVDPKSSQVVSDLYSTLRGVDNPVTVGSFEEALKVCTDEEKYKTMVDSYLYNINVNINKKELVEIEKVLYK